MRKGLLIVISGPSGTGKGTVCDVLRKNNPDIAYSVSATTRASRPGEKNGVNYYFHTREEFERMIENGELLEWAEVYGNYYGTPLKKIEEKLAQGIDILLEIDTQGAMNVKKKCPDGLFIFLVPPSLTELEKRLNGRGTETQESLDRRLGSAVAEIEMGKEYRYVVVNKSVETAANEIAEIIKAERHRTDLNIDMLNSLKQRKEIL
ncbi:MAG: guanylate kinase [Anaerovibrio sp.]|uniref:guanylate kinase n=1 Tax=Anaerovibrio sp. TaxID=1872532 RepID=UPI0025F7FE1A|nr:guanylate kinase [Anaerovibrio sp.]MCR5176350.1 guanylate kinase [Anaerovibrio sp.]